MAGRPVMRTRLAPMRSPLDILRREHALLRAALVAIERIGGHVDAGKPFPGADCATLLRFLRDFIGGIHDRKEAEVVFPAVAMYGGDDAAEQIGRLLLAQEQARELLHTLVLFWEPVDELSAAERGCFVETARAYCSHMQRMLMLEETVVFPLAETAVPGDDRLSWSEEFAAIGAERPAALALRRQLLRVSQRWH